MKGDKEAAARGAASVLRTAYQPELAAQAAFDELVEKMKAVPYRREGKSNGMAER